MADMSVTAGSVLKSAGALGLGPTVSEYGTLGATATAGQVVYRDAAASYKYKLAQATGGVTADARGILLNGGAAGQPAEIVRSGLYAPGGTVIVGMVYVVSPAAAGGIAPVSDLGSGHFVTVLGVGVTSSLILVGLTASGVAKP